ncbi:hypothetical protein K1T71_012690 [Dendrolimus kikuchii]|uniref:Uncharacterized protein n=1 Tax=Dendrolimus kikuchii TaxID=765133 RepID=A0ACC1CKC3_9NEOP|nr:hypothetical protein K1T71_012690 [Dendrolimus kikuchii]
MSYLPVFLFVTICLDIMYSLENGLARTPPMGWMSWGYYKCGVDCKKNPDTCLNEQLIISVADAFYEEGYLEAGYEYIIIDDCWSERRRDDKGRLVADAKRFPSGMKYIADYIHSKGLKFGMYTTVGEVTCMHYPGSRNHFEVDAKTFAEWDLDYLKVDGCFVEEQFLNKAYIKLGQYLNITGRPMVYSCSWPYYIQYIHKKTPDYEQIYRHCNLWRNYHDVSSHWPAIKMIVNHYKNNYDTFHKFHGPGHWHDPDMLVFGTNSLTEGQSRIQLSVYAMLSAPLLISCDMTQITSLEKRLLQNLDLISIGQDALGLMARPYTLDEHLTLWVKPRLPMKGDSYMSFSFALVNMGDMDNFISFTPLDYGLDSIDGYTVMDVLNSVFVRNVTMHQKITNTVPAEDVILYTLFPL